MHFSCDATCYFIWKIEMELGQANGYTDGKLLPCYSMVYLFQNTIIFMVYHAFNMIYFHKGIHIAHTISRYVDSNYHRF